MNNNTAATVKTTRKSEAHGAHCVACDHYFIPDNCQMFGWVKSVGMHQHVSGHKVTYFRFV